MGRFGKSILKGLKYAGLSVAAGALVGTGDVVPGLILDVLTKSGVPEVIGVLVSSYGTPLLGGAVVVALEQVRKHRDKVFAPEAPPEG